jgi:cation transport regulator ChaB
MPYKRKTDLPKQLKILPSEAKDIYLRTFNKAEKFYEKKEILKKSESTEITAAKVAWKAVKLQFKKVKDKWLKKTTLFI